MWGVWYRGESARSPRLYPGAEARRGGVCHPPRNYLDLFVTLLIELLGERVRERDQAAGLGSPHWAATGKTCVAAVAWQALDAKRRRLPHWGCEIGGERIRHARSLRRGGRCAGRHRCRCGKRAAATVAVRMRAAATKRKRLAPAARPATRAPGHISA